MTSKIKECRVCKNENLVSILNLGEQYFTGIFPNKKNEFVPKGPLELLKCHGNSKDNHCGLVQLANNFDFSLNLDLSVWLLIISLEKPMSSLL